MALIKEIDTQQGVNLPQAYLRVDELGGSKERIAIRVRTYASADAAQSGKAWLEESLHTFEPSVNDDAPNFIKQGYEYLKTLPEFADAADA